jgi:hypothetical protein
MQQIPKKSKEKRKIRGLTRFFAGRITVVLRESVEIAFFKT